MGDKQYAVRRVLLQQWLREQERSLAWAARQIGTTRHYLSDVMRGKRGFTDQLARRLQERLGISFDYQDPLGLEQEEPPGDTDFEPAVVAIA